ncbi:MAG: PD40 domain-containing protein [Prevotella sp.]|nr:PD40 domain-containing protein [Prevotella sp.]
MKNLLGYCLTAMMLLTMACQPQPHDVSPSETLPDIFPDYVGVTVPVDIAPLNFSMSDDHADWLCVDVKGSKSGQLTVAGEEADFDLDEWHQLLAANKGGQLTVTVTARNNGQWTRYRPFVVYISSSPIDEWGVTYRRIAPGYSMYGLMGIWQRCLSTFEETPLLMNSQSPGMCVNCHTSCRTNPDQYVFHVRGAHGATVIHREGHTELLKAKNDTLGGSMVYPAWHPGGRYCAFSTNKTAQAFHMRNPKLIEVYDNASDIFIYDTKTHTILRDTLTMTSDWSENCPTFSADGRWLYFTTALQRTYPQDYQKQRYNLCRIAFDERTGKMGQQVDTLIRADAMQKSISWPRASYDGRYIMYTLSNYGYFSVWHPEADLWLLDLQTGESRSMDEINSPRSESLHQWSSNSRWFLFTSRRDDGLYTRLYFAAIGDDGKATKPFLLPQRHPKRYYRQLMDSYNTPDFTSRKIEVKSQELGEAIESDNRIKTHIH